MAQSTHAAFRFACQWPTLTRTWVDGSNFLVVVAVPDEHTLAGLAARAGQEGVATTVVREPDYENTMTAVALEPGGAARRLCAQYPLALKPTSCYEVFLDTDGYNSMRIRGEGVHAMR